MSETLITYSREIVPMFFSVNKKKEILKEWVNDDERSQQLKQEIKDLQESLKEHITEKEAELSKEIADLELDIKLAVKAAARGTDYKPADLKAFFSARAKESVDKVVEKGETFAELNKELT